MCIRMQIKSHVIQPSQKYVIARHERLVTLNAKFTYASTVLKPQLCLDIGTERPYIKKFRPHVCYRVHPRKIIISTKNNNKVHALRSFSFLRISIQKKSRKRTSTMFIRLSCAAAGTGMFSHIYMVSFFYLSKNNSSCMASSFCIDCISNDYSNSDSVHGKLGCEKLHVRAYNRPCEHIQTTDWYIKDTVKICKCIS